MPGTIHVSVLSFNALQSSSTPSQVSIKVSMGKREYQTWDKGDFSFPLTTLRDNLIITLQDNEGNEISHTGIETKLVIEKGNWDDLFPLQGGGHVHLRLQFVLNEEDRQRIRTVRESALRKKHDELVNNKPRSPKPVVTSAKHVVSTFPPDYNASGKRHFQSELDPSVANQAGLTSPPTKVFKKGKSSPEDSGGTLSVEKQKNPNDTDRHEQNPSITLSPQGFGVHLNKMAAPVDVELRHVCSEEASSVGSSSSESQIPANLKRDGASYELEKQGSPSNVKNMISAFESSLHKDMRPKLRPPPDKSQSSKTGEEVRTKSLPLDEVKTMKIISADSLLGRARDAFHDGNAEQTPTQITKKEEQIGLVITLKGASSSQDTEKLELEADSTQTRGKNMKMNLKNQINVKRNENNVEKEKMPLEDLGRASTGERASVSGRMLNEQLGKNTFRNLSTGKQQSSGNSLRRMSGERIQIKGSQVNIQGQSRDKLYSPEHSSAWIFLDEGIPSCITTAGKQILNLTGSFQAAFESQPRKMSSCIGQDMKEFSEHGGTYVEPKGVDEISRSQKISDLECPTDTENPRGLVGQVMRAAIMVGFAALVLFTRQRSPDGKKRQFSST